MAVSCHHVFYLVDIYVGSTSFSSRGAVLVHQNSSSSAKFLHPEVDPAITEHSLLVTGLQGCLDLCEVPPKVDTEPDVYPLLKLRRQLLASLHDVKKNFQMAVGC